MIYDQCLDFTIRTLKALHRASRSSMMRVWSDVGKERLEVNHSPHGQRKPSALAGDLAIPFKGFTLASPPWQYHQRRRTSLRTPPQADGRFQDTIKPWDHIPVLNCRMQDFEEGGIESLFAFFSWTACPTMHSRSFTQSISFVCSRPGLYLLSPAHLDPVKRPCA